MMRRSGISSSHPVTAVVTVVAVAALAALAAGCSLALESDPEADGPEQTGPDAAAAAAAVADTVGEFTGRVAAEGTAQAGYLVLRGADAPPVALTGPLAGELRRLQNASVRVRGHHAAGGMARGGRVEVQTYTMLSIDGERPEVGVLLRRDGDFWLVAEESTLRLSGVPTELGQSAGAKIWVIGPRSDGGVRLRSYGIIRPPPE